MIFLDIHGEQNVVCLLLPNTSNYIQRIFFHIVFTARCTSVQSAVLRSHVVCLSVCNVGEL